MLVSFRGTSLSTKVLSAVNEWIWPNATTASNIINIKYSDIHYFNSLLFPADTNLISA
jgi:hypothetical protein